MSILIIRASEEADEILSVSDAKYICRRVAVQRGSDGQQHDFSNGKQRGLIILIANNPSIN
jgi:hypothetical protein